MSTLFPTNLLPALIVLLDQNSALPVVTGEKASLNTKPSGMSPLSRQRAIFQTSEVLPWTDFNKPTLSKQSLLTMDETENLSLIDKFDLTKLIY